MHIDILYVNSMHHVFFDLVALVYFVNTQCLLKKIYKKIKK